MPRVPGENNGLGPASVAVGLTSLVLGGLVFAPLLLGGIAGTWLAVRARQRVVDGDANNPRTVFVGFLASTAAIALFLVLLTVGVLTSSGVLSG
ncbi:hypothetical protein SAMN06264364_10674 [Quadrisphaera granulorum]|uniref:DUF4190 domain-containing protein n=1 Tax=Quadrisphaera granulorum TaxID=317664 RepID=A0A316AAI4_9ACTN|nr:hypothetical protein [Quadrisphaera granulorum]PWJ54631.1 hypothetical protein BXY45_10674 [Quadrisphaera granulorum]SZE95993.1 hypothetical protein SAMN06264364_10674 [Quadrisphaera granulorum]